MERDIWDGYVLKWMKRSEQSRKDHERTVWENKWIELLTVVGQDNIIDSTSRVGYSPGAREPGSHEIFRLTRNVGRNSRVFVTNLTGKCFLQNEAKSSCQTNAFLQKEEIFWCKSIITNRHFPQEEMSCHRKKFLATVRNLLPQEDFL